MPFVFRLLPLACLFLPLLLLAQPSPFQDQTTPPTGLRGERIRALLDAVNAHDPARIRSFLDQHTAPAFRQAVPPEEYVQAALGIYRQTGGVDFYSLRSYTPVRPNTVVIVRDRIFGSWAAFTMTFEGPEERLHNLNFSPARPPQGLAPEPPLTEAELVRTLREKLAAICPQDGFSGAVLLARGDQVLFEQACGEASKSWHVANTVDTKFNLGSMNKMFTATAVMQLVEAGKVKLDEPISRFVDEGWLPRPITERITVQHLLTHTSGLDSYFNDAYFRSSRDLFRQLDDYKPLVAGDTLAFEPGSRFQYSNTGMLLLGVVIEKASGQNYFDYIQQHIYTPAGMTRTDCYELDRPQDQLAEGYLTARDGGWQNNLFLHVLKGGPAGGGYSTVRDLHRFARALQTDRLVSAAGRANMWRNHSEAGYGFGFNVEQTPAGPVIGHGGGFPGLNSQLDIYPQQGYILVVMSNYDQGAEPLRNYIRGLILNRLQK